jgi:2-isopropylmalate synthase
MSEQVSNRIYLYDTTLRDGAQTQGVDFSVRDKLAIARALDDFGIDYIEGGWPGANPTDDGFFAEVPAFRQARLTAFGMTRRAGQGAANDPGLNALLNSRAPALCIVGKAWDFHVHAALHISEAENLAMIADSVRYIVHMGREALFDAEHFFDGYKENPAYALACIKAAHDAGARWVVLCDTNGGTLPHEITTIITAVTAHIPGARLGIHCHNDTENAVANSIAAVQAGARMIQGTLNGLGERCGNANLVSILPTLMLKLGFATGISPEQLKKLGRLSRLVDERLNRPSNRHAPYVGASAFAHKGGLHVSAVEKNPRSYEHIPPEAVGNQRTVVVSDQAGRATILARFRELGLPVPEDNSEVLRLVDLVKQREFDGYAYDGAEASFELLVRRTLSGLPEYYRLTTFRVMDERRLSASGELVTLSEATVKVVVNGEPHMSVAEGNGPVNALDNALRKVLLPTYPALADVQLVDYKVRILTPNEGTKALTRVMIESRDSDGNRWRTIGVSANVIDASYNALQDSLTYCLFRAEQQK